MEIFVPRHHLPSRTLLGDYAADVCMDKELLLWNLASIRQLEKGELVF